MAYSELTACAVVHGHAVVPDLAVGAAFLAHIWVARVGEPCTVNVLEDLGVSILGQSWKGRMIPERGKLVRGLLLGYSHRHSL